MKKSRNPKTKTKQSQVEGTRHHNLGQGERSPCGAEGEALLADSSHLSSDQPSAAPAIQGIAILGSHPATVEMAPLTDPSWMIYACSPHNVEHRSIQADQWFELHKPVADATRQYSYIKALERMPVVWMRSPDDARWIKGAVMYPEEELKDRFGPFFFTSSIAYMLAKAIVDCEQRNIGKIGIWGVMQASKTEYTYQRPGIQYFISRARDFGIDVVCPDVSRLLEVQKDVW